MLGIALWSLGIAFVIWLTIGGGGLVIRLFSSGGGQGPEDTTATNETPDDCHEAPIPATGNSQPGDYKIYQGANGSVFGTPANSAHERRERAARVVDEIRLKRQ